MCDSPPLTNSNFNKGRVNKIHTSLKIPGRWRRHCPNGPIMSGPGCNLVDDGTSDENGNAVASGKCVCGPSVPWCPGEPRPYDYRTRHECKLNLAAKIAYDDLLNSEDRANVVVDENENDINDPYYSIYEIEREKEKEGLVEAAAAAAVETAETAGSFVV
ncbi:hypothetical protein M0804_003913 [Polistes exclamans]|nr:hypothetical protein M0804_003913 [Polistes exclamans]